MTTASAEKPKAATLFRVAVVNVSTSFAGRHGRRVHTDLILVDGHKKIRVHIDELRYTKTSHARSEWSVGEVVETPELGDKTFVTLPPEMLKRAVVAEPYKPSELRIKSL